MATIIGSEGPDTLFETAGDDTIRGLAGDDIIYLDMAQTSGTDIIDGGAGSDRLVINRGISGVYFYSTDFMPSIRNGSSSSSNWKGVPTNIEHYTIYHQTGEGANDNIRTSSGDDAYYFTATNNQVNNGNYNQVELWDGSNDFISIDGSAVLDWGIEINESSTRRQMFVGSIKRIEFSGAERLHFTGGALADRITALIGDDVLDGRDGNDILNGLGGNDRLVGGAGNDTLNGGEGNDVINFTTGTDTVDGGNGSDRLEIDARAAAGAVAFSVGAGPPYSGSFAYAGGTVNYSGIESFAIYSSAGNFADDVTAGTGDDVFYHYGRNDLSYLMDEVDLGGGSNDLLVADFSAVTDHAVTKPFDPLPSGHYLFSVGGNGKVDFTGVERIHFIGGAQGDTVFGLPGDDILVGGAGGDKLYGYGGNDDLSAGTGVNNELDGGDGDDILRSVPLGFDHVNGGDGFDTAIIDYSDRTSNVTNQSGHSIAYGVPGDGYVALLNVEKIIITTGSGQDSIITQGGDDVIRSGAGTDAIGGEGGNDYLDGGPGGDDMSGGPGDDIYIVDNAFDFVLDESPTGGTDLVYTSLATYTLHTGVENLIATGSGPHTLRGNAGDNSVTGESGNDFLLMQDGGADDAFGRTGNDVVYFGAAYAEADFADGGVDRDAFVLQGNYITTLSGANLVGFESISLQSGANTQFGDVANNFYDFDITVTDSLVTAGQQMIVNAQSLRDGEDFTFDGSAETDGKFLIYGGHGVDDLTGGALVDVFFFEGSRWGLDDRVDGGGGRDSLVISAGSGLTHIEFGADSLTSIESISLNNLYASDPTQMPSYELVLHNGNVAPGGTLIVNGNSIPLGQTVSVDGSAVEDGNLMLFGGGGHDVLIGGDGADLIFGGGGADALGGAAGADTFRYDATSDSLAGLPDLIGDFQTGVDKIDLSRLDANTHAAGNQAFSWIGSSAFSGTGAASAGELRVFQDGGYQRIEGDTNGDGHADFAIVLQIGTAPIAQADFLL